MSRDWRQWGLDVISGKARGAGALCARCAATAVEPLYALAMLLRNEMYDRGALAVHDLGRPAISIGNITTGGTGKTPMVHWLASRLANQGLKPAILLRGYRAPSSGPAAKSDEQAMLESLLAGTGATVQANPDRVAAARLALADHPDIGVFFLDDAFQHRRAGRDLDIVLISATQPWGYGHIIPRGLLREPLAGLGRADVIIITRSDLISTDAIDMLKGQIARHNDHAPVFLARHALAGLLDGDTHRPLSDLSSRRYFAFAGIGDPESLASQLKTLPGTPAGTAWLADHHAYADGLAEIEAAARAAGADLLLTTEKDWAKIATAPTSLPVWRLGLELQIDGETELLEHIRQSIATASSGV